MFNQRGRRQWSFARPQLKTAAIPALPAAGDTPLHGCLRQDLKITIAVGPERGIGGLVDVIRHAPLGHGERDLRSCQRLVAFLQCRISLQDPEFYVTILFVFRYRTTTWTFGTESALTNCFLERLASSMRKSDWMLYLLLTGK